MNKSCLFLGLSGVSVEGGAVERTSSPCGGIVNIGVLCFGRCFGALVPKCVMIEIQAQRGMANQTHKDGGGSRRGESDKRKSCGLVLHTRYLSAMIELKGIKVGVLWGWLVGWWWWWFWICGLELFGGGEWSGMRLA